MFLVSIAYHGGWHILPILSGSVTKDNENISDFFLV